MRFEKRKIILKKMAEKEFVTKLLDIRQPMCENPNRFSTIILLLRSSRKLFGCDLKTGIYNKNELNEENFLNETYNAFSIYWIN